MAANQNKVELQKTDKSSPGHYVAVRTQESEQLAARTLKPVAFKLWLYITANSDGYIFDLSRADACAKYGIGTRSYTDALKELQEAGYMVAKPGKTHSFMFYDMPQTDEVISIEVCKNA